MSKFMIVKGRVRDALRESPLPISTSDLVLLCGDGIESPRAYVHHALRWLLNREDVEKLTGPGHRPGKAVRWKWIV